LEALLLDGLSSGEPVEADQAFLDRLVAQTDEMLAEHKSAVPVRESSVTPSAEADIIRQFRYYLVEDAPETRCASAKPQGKRNVVKILRQSLPS
jgi:hypothetical protein